MAIATDSIIEIVKRYIEELEKNGIEIREAIIFGSFVKGTAKEWRILTLHWFQLILQETDLKIAERSYH